MAEAPQENPQVTSSDVVEESVRETGSSAAEEEVTFKAAAPDKWKPLARQRSCDEELVHCTLLCTYYEKSTRNDTFLLKIKDGSEPLIQRLADAIDKTEATAERKCLACGGHNNTTLLHAVCHRKPKETTPVSFLQKEHYEQNFLPSLWSESNPASRTALPARV